MPSSVLAIKSPTTGCSIKPENIYEKVSTNDVASGLNSASAIFF
jgi:hypothetical protein